MSDLPRLEITVPDARTVLTTVKLNGARIPVTRVSFDTGESLDGNVKVRLEFYADLQLNAERVKLVLASEPGE